MSLVQPFYEGGKVRAKGKASEGGRAGGGMFRRAHSSCVARPDDVELVRIDAEVIPTAEVEAVERLMFDWCEKLFANRGSASPQITKRLVLQPQRDRDSSC